MTFDIDFQGKSIEVVALVLSSIVDGVLLSWQDLQRLGVIDPDFPNIGARAAVVSVGYSTVHTEQEARGVVAKMVEEFGSVLGMSFCRHTTTSLMAMPSALYGK